MGEEERHHGPGKLPGVDVKPRARRQSDRREQDVMFAAKPGHGLVVVADSLAGAAGRGAMRVLPAGRSNRDALWLVIR
jgi:hypothetical protein